MITQTNKIDLIPSGDPLVVHVSQYDTTARTLAFDLYNGGVAFEMPEGASASINGTKPDGTAFMYEMTTEGNTASIDLQQQMALVAGDVICEIQIAGSGGKLGTANFILRVERAAIDENTVISETDVPVFEELVESAEEAAAQAGAQATAAAASATSAAASAADAEAVAEQVAPIIPENPGTTGQVLTKTATGSSWQDPQGGGGGGSLPVNITFTAGSGYSADKTFLEIQDALDNNGMPYAIYNSVKYEYISTTGAVGSRMHNFRNTNGSFGYLFHISEADAATYTTSYAPVTATVTVSASAWTNGSAVLSVNGLTASQAVLLGLPLTTSDSDYEIIRQADIRPTAQAAGSITIEALGTVPTTDIVLQVTRW